MHRHIPKLVVPYARYVCGVRADPTCTPSDGKIYVTLTLVGPPSIIPADWLNGRLTCPQTVPTPTTNIIELNSSAIWKPVSYMDHNKQNIDLELFC